LKKYIIINMRVKTKGIKISKLLKQDEPQSIFIRQRIYKTMKDSSPIDVKYNKCIQKHQSVPINNDASLHQEPEWYIDFELFIKCYQK